MSYEKLLCTYMMCLRSLDLKIKIVYTAVFSKASIMNSNFENETSLVSSVSILEQLSALEKDVNRNNSVQRLQDVNTIFKEIKHNSFSITAPLIRRCALVASLCGKHIDMDSSFHQHFKVILNMQSYYISLAKKYKIQDEREIIASYFDILSIYGAFLNTENGGQFNLLSVLDNKDFQENTSTQNITQSNISEAKILASEDEKNIYLNKTPTKQQIDSTVKTQAELNDILGKIVEIENRHDNKSRQSGFIILEKEILDYVYRLRRSHPIGQNTFYSVNAPVIKAINVALKVEVAYISFLKKSNKNESTLELSRVLPNAAALQRLLYNYYCKTDASVELLDMVRRNRDFMCSHAFNIAAVIGCNHVISSQKVTKEERRSAKNQKEALVNLETIGLNEIYYSYQQIFGTQGISSSNSVNNFKNDISLLSFEHEYEAIKASVPAASFAPLMQKISAYLNRTFAVLMNHTYEQTNYAQFFDNHEAYEFCDTSRSIIFQSNGDAARIALFQGLEIYYKIKIKYDEQIYASDLFAHFSFISKARLDAYKYLLVDFSSENPEQACKECDVFANYHDLTTPFIQALAKYRSEGLVLPSDAEEISQKENDNSNTNVIKRERSKKNINNKKTDGNMLTKTCVSKNNSIWEKLSQERRRIPEHPHWKLFQEEYKTFLLNKEFTEAYKCILSWISALENTHNIDPMIRNKSLFDGWIYRATFERTVSSATIIRAKNTNDVQNENTKEAGLHVEVAGYIKFALECLENAEKYIVSESNKNLHYSQVQKIWYERGILHALQGKNEEAEDAFIKARESAKTINTPCFYLLVRDLETDFSTMNHNEVLRKNDFFIDDLLENGGNWFIDDYNTPFFYDFFNVLAAKLAINGLQNKQNSILAQASIFNNSNLESYGDMDKGIKIFRALLNRAIITKNTDMTIDMYLKLGSSYRSLNRVNSERGYFNEANDCYYSALKLAREVNNQNVINIVVKELVSLKKELGRSKDITKELINNASYQERIQYCTNYTEELLQEIDTLALPNNPEEEFRSYVNALKKHSILLQLWGLFVVLQKNDLKAQVDNQQWSQTQSRAASMLEKNITEVSAKVIVAIFRYKQSLSLYYKTQMDSLSNSSDSASKRMEYLTSWYDIEQMLLAKLKNITELHIREAEVIGSDTLNTHMAAMINQQESTLDYLTQELTRINNTNMMKTIDKCVAEQLEFITVDLDYFQLPANSQIFSEIITSISKKQFDVALQQLCVLNTSNEGLAEINKRRCFAIAQMMLFFLKNSKDYIYPFLIDNDVKRSFRDFYAAVKDHCNTYYNKASKSVYLSFESTIAPAKKQLKALKLEDNVAALNNSK